MENVYECTAFVRETRSDLLIRLGGGSVMDVAKKAATGLGSEVTHELVLKVDGEKKAFVEENLVADAAIVAPNLTKACPLATAKLIPKLL